MSSTSETPEIRRLLRRYAMHRDRWIAALCRHRGMNRSDYDALQVLHEHGPLTAGDLAAHLSLTTGSVTALIDRLETLGCATREPDRDDRRKIIVTLHSTAWQVGQQELKPYHHAIDATADQLSRHDHDVVARFLQSLNETIDDAGAPES